MRLSSKNEFLLAILATLVVALVVCSPAGAKKTRLLVETFGSAAQPTFQSSTELALDPASGDLLVADGANGHFYKSTINRYHADGTPSPFSALGTHVIDAKGNGECPAVPADCDQTPQNGFPYFGNSAGSTQIAVDSSGTLTGGNIYVTEHDVTIPPGLISTADRITIFASDGHYLGQLSEAGGTPLKKICGVAVDPEGNLYLAEFRPQVEEESPEGAIYKFDPSANPPLGADHVATFAPPDVVCGLAAGAGPSAGSLFAVPAGSGVRDLEGVIELDAASGSFEGIVTEEDGVAMASVDPVSGHLFLGGFPPFITDNFEFDAAGASAVLLSTFPLSTGTAANGAIDRVYVSTGGLNSKVNVRGPIVTIPEATTGSYEIEGDTSVRVKGTVNPDGEALTECFFEYDTVQYFQNQPPGKEGEATHGLTAPCVPSAAGVGSGTAPISVHADLTGLAPETLYHYRLVARNANAALYPEDPNGTARGLDQTFKTPSVPAIKGLWAVDVTTTDALLRATLNPENSATFYRFEWGTDSSYGSSSPEFSLGSDNTDRTVGFPLRELEPATTYHWRLVAENGIGTTEGADHTFRTFPVPAPPDAGCANATFRIGVGAFLPDCRAYEMVSPLDKAGADIRFLKTTTGEPAVLEQSADSGDKLAYGSSRAFGDAQSAPFTSQFIAERIAGSEWVTHSINPLRERAVDDVLSQWDTEFKAFTADLCQAWLITLSDPPLAEGGMPGQNNLYRRDDRLCGSEGFEALAPRRALPDEFEVHLLGISADGAHAVFWTPDQVIEGGSEGSRQVYESVGGVPRPVCILPNGKADGGTCTLGTNAGNGSPTLLHNAISRDGERIFWTDDSQGEGRLYARLGATQTVAVSKAAEEEIGTTGASRFWGASSDGGKAVFTIGEPGFATAKLYAFEFAGEVTSGPLAPRVIGLMGMSEDASRIYFASREVLTGEETNSNGDTAQSGEANLYLYDAAEGGSTEFVATLAQADLFGGVEPQGASSRNARVSPDGAHAVFVSQAPLTGYDNKGAESGAATNQLYRYDAAADELLCVSCNPSGARPVGLSDIPNFRTTIHGARVLSEDGDRVYFESADLLSVRDTNGATDVYQWEEPGAGTCTLTSPTYSPLNQGCLDLVSSGQSPLDSRFVESSPDGRDVFFATGSSLLPQDYDLIDIYDARVGGGLPIPQPPPPGCEGEACQPASQAPNDPTPASSSFQGAGNVVEAPPSCAPLARRARRLAAQAKRLRQAAKRAKAPARTRNLRRGANRAAKRAGRLGKRTKRCRAIRKRAGADRKTAR